MLDTGLVQRVIWHFGCSRPGIGIAAEGNPPPTLRPVGCKLLSEPVQHTCTQAHTQSIKQPTHYGQVSHGIVPLKRYVLAIMKLIF